MVRHISFRNLKLSTNIVIVSCAVLISILLQSNCTAFQKGKAQQDNQAALSDPKKIEMPNLSEFQPKSNLIVVETNLKQAKYSAIDIHTHFGFRFRGDEKQLADFVKTMDAHNIAICVSLDAKLGDEEDHFKYLAKHKDRFAVFCHIDFQGTGKKDKPATWACNQTGFIREVVEKLREAKKKGIVGVKFFKQFGLGYRNSNDSLIKIDDQRFDPIWKTCGELKLPVIIHTGDPAAFFQPIDRFNERIEELARHPEWSFFGRDFPPRKELLDARNRVIKRHPATTFIGAHMAGNPEDLENVSKWIAEYPNLYVEIASRIGELGRQPITARKFILQHQDRVLFGTDGPWSETRLKYYWRFLETRDENFPYSEKTPPPQGLWNIYGIGLSDEPLQKIYFKNALKIIPGLAIKYATVQKLKK